MAKRQVGKCRFYCDIPSYLKSVGLYRGTNDSGLVGSFVGKETWNMNPYQINSYEMVASNDSIYIDFWLYQNPSAGYSGLNHNPDPELSKLLSFHNTIGENGEHHSSGWYAGILGHNLASLGITHVAQRFLGTNTAEDTTLYANSSEIREIVNFKTQSVDINIGQAGYPEYDGFSLWEITNKDTDSDRYNVLQFYYAKDEGDGGGQFGTDSNFNVGSQTCGIFFEPEHSVELSATISYSQEGIKKQTTVGGSTITNINYLGVPNWGDQPAWTLQKTDGRDYTTVANRGRRQWKVGLSFVADNNMFDKAGNANKFYNDSFTEGAEDAYSVDNFDTSLSSFFKLTHTGSLPFIFCPDSQADDLEFALCRITNKPSFKQVANNLFSTSLVLTETW